MMEGMYTAQISPDDDPGSVHRAVGIDGAEAGE